MVSDEGLCQSWVLCFRTKDGVIRLIVSAKVEPLKNQTLKKAVPGILKTCLFKGRVSCVDKVVVL